MERFVELDSLPEGLAFPAHLADRMHFDAPARRLCFHGFMSKADFDRLYLLSESWAYRRALEELFRRCTVDEADPGPLRHIKALLSSIGFI